MKPSKIGKVKRVDQNENNSTKVFIENRQTRAKKRNIVSTAHEPPQKKRTALGDLTNAIGKSLLGKNDKKQEKAKPTLKVKEDISVSKQDKTVASSQATSTSRQIGLNVLPQESASVTALEGSPGGFPELDASSQESVYVTPLDASPGNLPEVESVEVKDTATQDSIEEEPPLEVLPVQTPKLPEGVTDFDAENLDDPLMASEYAMDIFKYYLEREEQFLLKPYLEHQPGITTRMRAILVDWLVELQESMELNHETLYHAVKIIDQFLEKRSVTKERLQLLGATAVLIACKYEERCLPPIEDLLYVCDNVYSQEELLQLEMDILSAIDFELGAPLSYRFLRRYARVERLGMDILTLARYVLEMSLHDYSMVFERESLKAAGSLLLALRMRSRDWSPQLQYYSGYEKGQLIEMARRLNIFLHHPIRDVRNVVDKYSHTVFFEVAKVPLLAVNFTDDESFS